MRKTLLLLAAFVATLAVNAQSFNAFRFNGTLQQANTVAKQVKKAKQAPVKKANLADNQRLVGAYTTDDVNNAVGLGSMATGVIEPGVLLAPSDYTQFANARVVGIRFALGQDATATGVAVYGLTESSMETVASVDTTIVSQTTMTQTSINPVWNTVLLPPSKQFNLSDSYLGYMVSYKVTPAANTYPIATSTTAVDHDLYVNANISSDYGGNGQGWYSFGSDYGAAAIQLIVEGDFPANGLIPTDFGQFSNATGKTKSVPVTFLNIGTSLNSFSYTYTVNGTQLGEEKTVTLSNPLGNGGSVTENVDFQAPGNSGKYPVVLTVTKVNGVDNGSATKTSNGTMVVVSKELPRHVVMEEFTGTGCGWCPRGLVAMKKLAAVYGNQFIGIGIHQYNRTDAMYNTNYADLGFTGAPSCMLDRNGSIIDPYYGSANDIADDINERLEDLPLVGVDVKGSYSADSTQVVATATIDPLVTGQYEIAYVVTADGLTGTANSWKQTNYYNSAYGQVTSASQLPEDLQFLYNEGEIVGQAVVYSPEFNDVLIGGSYNSTNNQAGTVDLTEGTLATKTYTTTLVNSATPALVRAALQYDKVNIVALVIDPTTGAILNAAKAPVTAYDAASGIKAISNTTTENAAPVAIYTISGQRVNSLQPGVNIVKYANGKSVKVLKK